MKKYSSWFLYAGISLWVIYGVAGFFVWAWFVAPGPGPGPKILEYLAGICYIVAYVGAFCGLACFKIYRRLSW